MLSEYVGALRKKKQDRLVKEKIRQIEQDMSEVARAIEVADLAFNEVSDPNLTSALIFDRASLEERYNYLLKELKNLVPASD